MSTDVSPPADLAAETAATAPEARARRRIQMQEAALPVVVVLLLVAGTIADREQFLTSDNMLTVLTQASVTGVVAMGMTFVIATGGIDLSVGSVLAAAAIAGGLVGEQQSLPFILGAIGFGVLLGLINGVAIAYGRIVPFIATLAMFAGARGLALWMSDKTPISLLDLDVVRDLGRGKVAGIPNAAIVFVLVTTGAWVLLNRTRYGRHVIAVGGNREAARMAGIRLRPIITSVYALSGLCVGIAAVLLSGRLGSASPVAGNLLELDAIAAVVIGGTSLAGGRATIVGTFLGVITFGLLFNLLNLLDMPTELQQLSKGVIILAAAALQRRDG
ncbi:MAG TPA: ABC transporter permease [Acidimicrobiales bacterium]|nr:ABC transporter permease [Acidimicrobiales bacterium]